MSADEMKSPLSVGEKFTTRKLHSDEDEEGERHSPQVSTHRALGLGDADLSKSFTHSDPDRWDVHGDPRDAVAELERNMKASTEAADARQTRQ